MSRQIKHFYEFGPFRLDPEEHLLLRDGVPVPLAPKAFETLVALVQNSGHILEKDELIKKVWSDTFVEEGSLKRNISALRKALDEDPDEPQFIETVTKHGYRFVAEVREVLDESAAATVQKHGRGHATNEDEPGAQRDRALTSLAVLPLINADADPQMMYLSDGITESIINSLSQLPQLRVVARSTIFRYKGRDSDPQTVGRDLGVGAVLVGRVRQVGDRLVISTELVDAANGWQLWGEQYNCEAADIFAVQAEIAREIAEKLRLKLTGEEQQRLAKRYTENTAAYEAYLRGRHFWSKRTEEGIRKGATYFQQAIDLDPAYALAYAGLADSYLIPGIYSALPPGDVFPRAKAAAKKALELDETLVEAHTSLAFAVMLYDWDGPGAERGFQRAIELGPNYPIAHLWYSVYLASQERPAEAVAEARRARELDPLSLIINAVVGWVYYFVRQYDQTIEHCQKTLELEQHFVPAHTFLGLAHEQKGMYAEAIAELQKAVTISEGKPFELGALGHALAVAGKRDAAREVLGEVEKQSQQHYFPPYHRALIYTGLGERDQALRWLEEAYQERYPWLVLLRVEPRLDSLRSDPKFTDLERRVGLTPVTA